MLHYQDLGPLQVEIGLRDDSTMQDMWWFRQLLVLKGWMSERNFNFEHKAEFMRLWYLTHQEAMSADPERHPLKELNGMGNSAEIVEQFAKHNLTVAG